MQMQFSSFNVKSRQTNPKQQTELKVKTGERTQDQHTGCRWQYRKSGSQRTNTSHLYITYIAIVQLYIALPSCSAEFL